MNINENLIFIEPIFLIFVWLIMHPSTKYAKWCEKKCGNYTVALWLNLLIACLPLFTIALIFLYKS